MNADALDDEIEGGEDGVEEYEPRPAILADGDVMVMDPVELCDLCNALAYQARDGVLFVLKRDGQWVNVSDALKPQRSTVVQAVRTKQ
jgi:hypothetical protein